jgi:hypothetical protein
MTDESNREHKPVRNPNTGGINRTATGQGPQRPDNEPQVADDGSTAPGDADANEPRRE